MTEKTALIIVIFPLRESNQPFQPANLFRTFSMSGNERDLLRLPVASAKPKLVMGNLWMEHLKIREIKVTVEGPPKKIRVRGYYCIS